MSGLLDRVLTAHGGLDRWNELSEVTVRMVSGGAFWGLKGLVQDPAPRRMTVRLHEQWGSLHPFGAPDQRTEFTPGRIAIEKLDGTPVAAREQPRDGFEGHDLDTPWDPLHRAYFNGYALWTYLTAPFHFAMTGFSSRECEPVRHGGERWPGLQVAYPSHIASHSTVQYFYFGEDHLLRRHDYQVDVAGGFHGVHYVSDFVDADGIQVPTTRRAYRRDGADGPVLEQVMVSIDLDEIRFS